MDDLHFYLIRVLGRLAAQDIEPFSPPGTTMEQMANGTTSLLVRTDQSGVVGLIRNLHGLGCVLLFFEREENNDCTYK